MSTTATPPAKKKAATPPAKKQEDLELEPVATPPAKEAVETPVAKSDFKIEKNVPIPPRAGGRNGSKYPFRQLQVGDSTFVEGKPSKIASALQAAAKLMPKVSFTSRATTEDGKDGVRVWRQADKA